MPLKLTPLVLEEVVGQRQYTHYCEVKFNTAEVAAMSTVNTAVVIPLSTAYKYNRIDDCCLIVQQPFEDTADAAYNSTTISVGETGTPTGYINAAECNKNAGGLVKSAYKTGAITVPKDYAADTGLVVTVNAMAAKALSNLKKGSAIILFRLFKFAPPVDTDSV